LERVSEARVSNLFGEDGSAQFNRVVWRKKGTVFFEGRKDEFLMARMSFGVRRSGLKGVGISGLVVVRLEVAGKGEEISISLYYFRFVSYCTVFSTGLFVGDILYLFF